jgi:outer membrane protein insertion porin family
VRLAWERRAGGVALVVEVDERPLVGGVFFAAPSSAPEAGLWIPPLAGDLYDPAMVARALRALERSWIGRGHVDARANVRARRAGEGHVDLCFLLDPGPRWIVERVEWPGARRVSAADLRGAMDTRSDAFNVEGKPFRPDLLTVDGMRLGALLYDRGFLGGSVKAPRVTRIPERSAVIVEIPVIEGPEYRIGRLDVRGRLAGPRQGYAKHLGQAPGDVFSRKRMVDALERMRAHHRAITGKDAEIEPKTELHEERGVVDLVIQVKGR